MSQNLLLPNNNEAAPGLAADDGRPAYVPPKFWDAELGEVRVEAMARSYAELERRLSEVAQTKGEVPERPEDYRIEAKHELLASDHEVNCCLHKAGFTNEQAQLVYDLAGEKVLPMLADMDSHMETTNQVGKLEEHFGGPARWEEISRQIMAWASKSLPEDVWKALSSNYDGVLALHRMMTSGEPGLTGGRGGADEPLSEDKLKQMMNDPKYWRDKDPAYAQRIADGFKRLYPGQASLV